MIRPLFSSLHNPHCHRLFISQMLSTKHHLRLAESIVRPVSKQNGFISSLVAEDNCYLPSVCDTRNVYRSEPYPPPTGIAILIYLLSSACYEASSTQISARW